MIYILEDDAAIRKLVLYTLNQQGFEACGFEEWDAFDQALKQQPCDLILLDIMLPKKDGITILKELKEDSKTASIPVIMLTAKTSEYDKVLGLDLGADDYVSKPFGMMELLARIKAVLRRVDKKTDKVLIYKDLVVDVEKHQVKVNDELVILTKKEFEILVTLLSRIGHCFTREYLLDTIWGYDLEFTSRTVDVHIRTLRSKLKTAGAYIETVRGIGYRIGE